MQLRQLLLLTAAFLLGGCEEEFSAIEPSALRFSIYGYLDVAADTQWIRVTPIRSSQATAPDPLGVQVSLHHLETAEVIPLRDSLIHVLSADPEVAPEGMYLHNFWTSGAIEPGASYRLSVREGGEPAAETVIRMPPDYELEVWNSQRGLPDQLRVAGLEHVAFIDLLTQLVDECGPGVVVSPLTVPSTNDDLRLVTLPAVPLRPGCGVPDTIQRDLRVVGAGSRWPSTRRSAFGLGAPDLTSGISSSVGFVGGVFTKTIPLERCRQTGVDVCRIRYEPGWATIEGRITDPRCGQVNPVRGAMVELTELEPEAPGAPLVRFIHTRPGGQFRIRGLRPDTPYALRISRSSPIPTQDFMERHDTLRFSANQVMNYDAALQRRQCPG